MNRPPQVGRRALALAVIECFLATSFGRSGAPNRNGCEYLKLYAAGTGSMAPCSGTEWIAGFGHDGAGGSVMWRSSVCANAILTVDPKRSIPKLAGAGAASAGSGSGVSIPTMGTRPQGGCSAVRRTTHCSGKVAAFGRSAVAGTTCTILEPPALSSL